MAAGGVEQVEQWIYTGGGVGQGRVGDKEDAAKEFAVTAPAGFGSGGFDGNYGQYTLGSDARYLLDIEEAQGDSHHTKITYLQPEIGSSQGGGRFPPTDDAGQAGDPRSAAHRYAETPS